MTACRRGHGVGGRVVSSLAAAGERGDAGGLVTKLRASVLGLLQIGSHRLCEELRGECEPTLEKLVARARDSVCA